MAEKSISMDYSVGHIRMKYLDFANIHFTQNNFIACKADIDNFIDTINVDSDSGKEIKKEFDNVYKNKNKVEQLIEDKIKELGFLERQVFENDARNDLEVNTIHDLKEICWRVALHDGLFNE